MRRYTVQTDPVENSTWKAIFYGVAYGCLVIALIIAFYVADAALGVAQ